MTRSSENLVTTYKLVIEIPGLPKTPNARMHWRVKALEAKKWRNAVCLVSLSQRPDSPLKKALVECTRFSTSRPDFDNLAASFKNCLDGLQDAGVIKNDNFETIGNPEYKWEKTKKGMGKIRIVVTEVKS
jgi:Holliday junction resolvase RusA-like endonuclease